MDNANADIPEQEQQEWNRREKILYLTQYSLAIAFLLFVNSEMYIEVAWVSKVFSSVALEVVFVVQFILMVVVSLFGPFDTEVVEWKGGFLIKTVFDAGVSFAAFWFLVLMSEERPNTMAYLTRHNLKLEEANKTHNLIDAKIFAMNALLAIYSLLVSFQMQPGLDLTILGTFLELILHMTIEANFGGTFKTYSTFVAMMFAVVLILLKNWNECRARARIRARAQAPAPATTGNDGANDGVGGEGSHQHAQ